ncbi:phosphotransferase family protein [Nocardioides bigeumensis]|uniref:Aminoglycoside phosphotransferase domain-containing protein n=1 Tax=Nocardioides bigeumensis TaxID=433657 RepID=A0ABN2XWU6_9ACTN
MDQSSLAASLTPLAGGWSGQTFVGEVAGERCVVRVYAGDRTGLRGERAHEVDAALLHLVRGLVPVPQVLELRAPDVATDAPALLITSFLPGVRGDLLLPTLDDAGLATLGANMGRLAADLGGMPMLRSGTFVDADLALGDLPGPDGLPEWVAAHEVALSGFTRDELAGLRELAVDAQGTLDVHDRRCLVHGDLNPKNVLVDPGSLVITGLVDWEFAHAGHPFTDLGNLVRFERMPAYVDGLLAAYTERHGGAEHLAEATARAADLWALVDLAARHQSAPDNTVAADAHDLLRAISASRDLRALPGRA